MPITKICKLLLLCFIVSGCKSGVTVPSSGTSSSITSSTSGTETIRLKSRYFELAFPENYEPYKGYKLLLAFHGSGSNASAMQALTRFETLTDEYLVVYPKSKVEEWNEGCGCNKPNRLGIDDLGFVDNIIEYMETNYQIIPGEIYATGYSQGALFTQNLLCNRSNTFKALASVAAPMSVQLSESCNIDTPTDYLLVHGTADGVLPFGGLAHSNFGLISSPDAIELLAGLNNINTSPSEFMANENIHITEFKNDENTNRLVSVMSGAHTWDFPHYQTSREILAFFKQASKSTIDKHSQLVAIDDGFIHVRSMGEKSDKPSIVLISGPNENFHADSAWFSLLQPVLAETHHVLAVDRRGNMWGSLQPDLSYTKFADDLLATLTKMNIDNVVLVSFASGNITSRLFYDKTKNSSEVNLKGMLWIDPDIFTDEIIRFYQDYPVNWYKEKYEQLIPYLAEGKWTERTIDKIEKEKQEIVSLIPEKFYSTMDWQYFELAATWRTSILGQQVRATEIANYHDDLENMKGLSLIEDIPVSVIDTDFEQPQIDSAEENKAQLLQWMTDGTKWSKKVVSTSGGQYIPLVDTNHLVTFQQPEIILQAVNVLIEK